LPVFLKRVLLHWKRLQVFANEVIRRIFGPMKDEESGDLLILCNDRLPDICHLVLVVEVTRNSSKLHIEEFHNLHSSPSIISVVKSRILRLARHVVHTR
jgi:hypothetical protein